MPDCCVVYRELCSVHLKSAFLNYKMCVKEKTCLKFWRLEKKKFCSQFKYLYCACHFSVLAIGKNCNCYHFSQEVSTKTPQVSTFFFQQQWKTLQREEEDEGGWEWEGEDEWEVGVQLSNEIRATLVDHDMNHGLTMREAFFFFFFLQFSFSLYCFVSIFLFTRM